MSEILKSKKGFLLHKDSLSILSKMNDEQAGILFKAIYQYQTTGKTPSLEFALEMAITPFINQFKRDDKAWEEERNKNAISGFIGNLKRWHADLYDDYINKKVTIEEAKNIIVTRQSAIGGDRQRSDTIPNVAKIAVNVSGSVKESVSGSVKENKLIVQNEDPFDQFWKYYTPIEQQGKAVAKGNKREAGAEYKKQLKQYTHKRIMQGLMQYLTFCSQKGQLTKQAVMFLKKQTFRDEFNIVVKPPTEAEKGDQLLQSYLDSITN